jgi:Uma2 family endonuclease
MSEITPEKLVTSDELWEMKSESDHDKLTELHQGVIKKVGGSGGEATIIAALILSLIQVFVRANKLGYVTGADGTYRVATNPDTDLIPDVGFIQKSRMPKPIPKKYLFFAPDLAVEVVSPNDKAPEIRKKVSDYLLYGTRLVWVVYPALKRVDVFDAANPGEAHLVDENGVLDGGSVLPGFKLPVKDIFEDIED